MCLPYASLTNAQFTGGFVSPPATVDSCGNFAFQFSPTGFPQLDATYFCTFVAHVDATIKQLCNGKVPGDAPSDPNGTAPCSGGFCPTVP